MHCTMEELCRKEVINICNGNKIGYICDITFESETAHIKDLLVEPFSLSFFRKKNCTLCIPWNAIRIIGKETVLVQYDAPQNENQHHKMTSNGIFFKKQK